MIVPSYWAEAKRQIKPDKRRMTIRRFGWSDESQTHAQQHADERLAAAVTEITAGADELIREPKVAYNGADGLPIREEIIARRDDAVLTRNAYGACCLNTPDVLFADVDATPLRDGCWVYLYSFGVYVAMYVALAWEFPDARSLWLFLLGGIVAITGIGSAWHWLLIRITVPPKQAARNRIEKFAAKHPGWGMRLYETPNGWRVLVTHATFDPRGEAVRTFFTAIGCDPIYVRMCFNQNCFRARVSPKPWRVGISDHMRPRPGVWPVSEERMPDRIKWVRRYERAAQDFSSCRFVNTLGDAKACKEAIAIRQWHDELAKALTPLPIA